MTEQLPATPLGNIDPSLALPQPQVSSPEKRADYMQGLHNDAIEFAENSPALYPAEDIGLPAGGEKYDGAVIAEVAIPGENDENDRHFAIMRLTRKEDGRTGFAAVGLIADPETGKAKAVSASADTWLALNDGKSLTFGRSADAVSGDKLWGSPYSRDVSRHHLTVARKEGKIIIEDTSSNGSRYITKGVVSPKREQQEESDGYVAYHTLKAHEAAELRGMLKKSEKGRNAFWGRETIDRDSEIGGNSTATVDIRSWVAGAEAIVVDGKRPETKKFYDSYVDGVMGKLKQVAEFSGRGLKEDDVTKAIYETIVERMQYDLAHVNDWSNRLHTLAPDHRKIDLAAYLEEGKGVCRHMALMAAWLGGEFKAKGYLTGKLTAEVNQKAEIGAHEWARYTDRNGKVTIIDPAQRYYGSLEASREWDYRRDEEKRPPTNPQPATPEVDLSRYMDENGVIVRVPSAA